MVRRSKIFFAFVFMTLSASILIKLSVAGSVLRPDDASVAASAVTPLERGGYNVAGVTKFAGRSALLVNKNDCPAYFIPVSPQGWHNETVKISMSSDQSVYFVYQSKVTDMAPPRINALLSYYSTLALAYIGYNIGYYPIFAVVTPFNCKIDANDVKELARMPFNVRALM